MATITISSTWPQDCPATGPEGASQFVTKKPQIGVVACGYQQLSCDIGAGDRVGCFKSSVYGVGPLIAYIAPIDEQSRRRRRP